jgi:hypothetical protein
MSLHIRLIELSIRTSSFRSYRGVRFLLLMAAFSGALSCAAQSNAAPDVLVLSNGDALHGKLVRAELGTVTFHSEPLGDIALTWDKIKELRTSEPFAVINDKLKVTGRQRAKQVPTGTLDVKDQALTLHPKDAAAAAPMPLKNAQYIVDEATLDKHLNHRPGILAGWNGAATAGSTVVTATQSQFAISGGMGLVRIVPTVSWLNPHDRTSLDFIGSFGKITEPAYVSAGTVVPEVVTKTAIYHAGAERDEYFSPRLYALVQAAFDHNFAQNLDLQQIYGGGIGWTVLKTPRQEADLKGTLQYEKQQFITAGPGDNLNLIGSTFGADYVLHLKLVTYMQSLAYIPAYNNMQAYSAYETNTFTFPVYKNLGFSIGTMDSYLNNPPLAEPPTKSNSFQFTMGLTYALKSKY